MTANRIFVSYSSNDHEDALRLSQFLKRSGYDVWVDRISIHGGQIWFERIVQGIDACDVLVLLLSKTSIVSENVVKELAIACEGKKGVLPLRLDDVELTDKLRYHLAGLQYLDYRREMTGESEKGVLNALKNMGYGVDVDVLRPTILLPCECGRIHEVDNPNRRVSFKCERSGRALVYIPRAGKYHTLRKDNVEFALNNRTQIIGRDDDSDSIFNVPDMSGRHCEIEWKEDRFTIKDLESTNGTYLNEEKLESHIEYPLVAGDLIRLGSLFLRYVSAE